MLGKTAGGLFWMFRYLERAENIARLFDTGYRISVTRSASSSDEWSHIITAVGSSEEYLQRYDEYEYSKVVNFLLCDKTHGSSVISSIIAARQNARLVRTALTREVWEAVNETWLTLKTVLSKPVKESDLSDVLALIRQQTSHVRGALHGTMLRNDIYNFTRLGTFIERADNTARILDVKYYVLLPSISYVGSSLDNVQWEAILRSVSGERAFRWIHENEEIETSMPTSIVKFLVLDGRMPRSLNHSTEKVKRNLRYLSNAYDTTSESLELAKALHTFTQDQTVSSIFDLGLHEFLKTFIQKAGALGTQIEKDFRFYD
ncbi:alpha-E domain-containing protein [Hirschia baltica]|uniref:DUF403 domain-containing protein n=1 Tax=Hirschia baltica (strain ATCC 49814 / DSM 5838 / IFAM 1418) TaxID=582402 RepID=C6XLI2_HIRBI|nr:alpha-E domain-containing protein [Hirschia baltica]ACT59781.1 protein of unknown function DUF403 [Hirschia baltica ATCC 49814]